MLALHIGKGFVPLLLALVLPGRSDCVGVGAVHRVPREGPMGYRQRSGYAPGYGVISTEKQASAATRHAARECARHLAKLMVSSDDLGCITG